MYKTFRNAGLLFIPFFLMILVNETNKNSSKKNNYTYSGIKTINSSEKIKNKCTWVCHNNTRYCKTNHVKFNHKYFSKTDPLYFGLINCLDARDSYAFMNVFFLVAFIPLMIWYFLIKSMNIQDQIVEIKKNNSWKS
jgi:hypothetical protein